MRVLESVLSDMLGNAHFFVESSVFIDVGITGISKTIVVCVFLAAVGHQGAVVL